MNIYLLRDMNVNKCAFSVMSHINYNKSNIRNYGIHVVFIVEVT